MINDDVPTVIFVGAYEEVLFVKTLIESAGILTNFEGPTLGRGAGAQSRLLVRQADAEHAGELVDDFRANGRRTTK